MAVYRLDDESIWFPDPEEANGEYDGLLAVGGDYKPERLLLRRVDVRSRS